eukprot:TRINITY_DN28972_c0_g1_i1.p1 TRINITY_DN28972_c0_g1~~TRINITY_DN28972_c0_g1_i1.p1  ORF type:complete len:342 (+),score=102.87 TRINITY_DN28972_c0_g1_i1:144-1028(+)
MEARCKAHVEEAREKAGKGKKAKQVVEAAERETEQWMYELKERHKEEVEELEERLEGGAAPASEAVPAVRFSAEEAKAVDDAEDEEARARRKKEKAQKKRQGRADKEAQREADKEREKLEAGPSARDEELQVLQMRLAALKPPMRIHEIVADGHCIYRSVGDQLRRFQPDLYSFKQPADQVHAEMRGLCATALRDQSENYAPFAELKDGEDFEGYCSRVESSVDWGGELELRALADRLKVRIEVFRAEASEPLVLGETASSKQEPLRVSFHRHYYALGEHYNSVVPLESTGYKK